ncbi:uncharacterized protein [Montipora foliosa]|uniref:uncharacterized protein n=1 Tax=Montipora foliosa TaxID=591990 RepID=UPI0035F10341
MCGEGDERAPAQNLAQNPAKGHGQNPADHISGNIMNFEQPKFNIRQENRLEALKAFKKTCGYIFKGSLVNISEERKCILVQDWLGPGRQKIYDSLDSGEDEDRQVRDQFVNGVSDDDLNKKLLEKGNALTRIQAVSIGKAHETTNQEVQECCQKPHVSDSTKAVLKDKPNKGLMCNYRANKKGSHSFINKRHCPAWGALCNLCKTENHFKDSKEFDLYKEISGDHDLQDLNTTFRPVLSLYDEKTQIQTLGTRKCFVFNPATGEEGIIQFRIVAEDVTPLIGLSDSEELKLIELLLENIATLDSGKPNVPSSASELHTPLTLQTIHCKDPEVFENCVGKLDGELHLYTKQDVTPTKAAPKEIPLSVKNKFIAEVKDLEEQGIIEKVTEPTDWVSAPTIVSKPSAKNGIRLCIVFRPLNTALKRSEYPIPTVGHLFTAIWHVPLDEPSSLLTTFNTPFGRMKWKRMPFGISVAPEEFQRRIDESLEGLGGTKAIAHDILI